MHEFDNACEEDERRREKERMISWAEAFYCTQIHPQNLIEDLKRIPETTEGLQRILEIMIGNGLDPS